jgi:uncharacterized OsmC-like protein
MARELKDIVKSRIGLFERKPEAAIYNPKVTSRHIEKLYTETSVRDHTVKIDYAEPAGGTNKGPNPIEMLLSAFGACVEAAFFEFAEFKGFKIDSLSVEVEGTLDLRGLFMVGDVPSRFKNVKYIFDIETQDNKEEITALAKEVIAHCPVVDSLINPVEVNGEIRINSKSQA